MEYPRLVFISPGKNKCNGGTYDCEVVREPADHKAALDAGFSDSVPEALESANTAKEAMKSDDKMPAAKRGRPAKVE